MPAPDAAPPAVAHADGIRAIAKQEEPVGRLLSRLEVAEGLVLDKVGLGGWVRVAVWVALQARVVTVLDVGAAVRGAA